MYCQNCGSALNPQTRYCNRCGTQLVLAGDKSVKAAGEKRLDEYLDGLFWISVFGLAFIVGGTILLKKFNFGEVVLLIYVVLSSTVFLINFGLSLWNALSMMRRSKEGRLTMQPGHETRELTPPSVTENTTRSFEPVLQDYRIRPDLQDKS